MLKRLSPLFAWWVVLCIAIGAVGPAATIAADPAVSAVAPSAQPARTKPKPPPAFPGPKNLPPTGPYKPLFYLNDFSYKQDPKHQYVWGEEFKDLTLFEAESPFILSTGGELRHRYINEDNRLRPGLPIHTDYNQWRWRHYVDARYRDFRVYFEGIDASTFDSSAPDQAIDVNRWNLQNAFFDWKFAENDLGKHTFRYGRQELLFGRQRLISPLDWANTRRNFEGFRYLVKGQDYTFDAFAVNPANAATGFISIDQSDNRFGTPASHAWFSGAYWTYTGWQNSAWDLYYLHMNGTPIYPNAVGGDRHTLGSRYARLIPITGGNNVELRVWDIDVEGGMQFGRDRSQDVVAGFFTAVLGHKWKDASWQPRLSGLFYYGSGNRGPGSSQNGTFSSLFPLGHAYWGLSDNLIGQNLFDYSLQADLYPTQKLGLTSAIHWFALASANDRLYTVSGAPLALIPGTRDIGQALDLYGFYAVNPNLDLQVGYSWSWYGDVIDRISPRGDASQFYVQTSLRY